MIHLNGKYSKISMRQLLMKKLLVQFKRLETENADVLLLEKCQYYLEWYIVLIVARRCISVVPKVLTQTKNF